MNEWAEDVYGSIEKKEKEKIINVRWWMGRNATEETEIHFKVPVFSSLFQKQYLMFRKKKKKTKTDSDDEFDDEGVMSTTSKK